MSDQIDLFAQKLGQSAEKIRTALVEEFVRAYRKGMANPESLLAMIEQTDFAEHILGDLGFQGEVEDVLQEYDQIAKNIIAQKIGRVNWQTIERLKDLDALTFMNHVRDVGVELTRQMTMAVFGQTTEEAFRDALLKATAKLTEAQIGSLTNTALRTFERATFADSVADLPDDAVFEYVGGSLIETSRDFCREWYGKQITKAELDQLTNDFGEPAKIYAGGWNCRHSWELVTE